MATDRHEPRAGNKLDSFQHVGRVHFLADQIHHEGAKLRVQISAGLGRVAAETSTNVLTGAVTVGAKSVAIGGGLVGCETALSLVVDGGKEAVVVKMMDDILLAADHALNNGLKLRSLMKENNIRTICQASVTSIRDGNVFYMKDGTEEAIECDSVVLACGYKPTNQLAAELADDDFELSVIGDSLEPRNIFTAVHEAFHTVRNLFTPVLV